MVVTNVQPLKDRGAIRARRLTGIGLNIFTTLLAFVFMFPFVWSVSSSLKTAMEVTAFPPRLFPRQPQWGNYREAWTSVQFGLFFVNSAVVTVLSLVGQIASSLLVAYGFARLRFYGRGMLFLVCLSGMMMPVYVTIIPLFTLFRALKWLDTLKPLIVPNFFGGAFAIFLLRQFIMTIPYELDESAFMDGARKLTILTRIILPNCKPVIATLAIFIFRSTWNNFLGPLIYLDSVKNFTLPMGLWFLRDLPSGSGLPKDHLLMAGSVITTLPVVIVFAVAQNFFVEGIVMSGIKG